MKPDARTVPLALVVAVATAVVMVLVTYGPASAASDRLPDLGMEYPKGLKIETTVDGERHLRFASIIVNVGAGPFELHGQRAPDASTMDTVQQRIFDDTGTTTGYRDVPTPATMVFGGDGHNHWHVRDLMDFELERLDNGSKVGTFEKRGFCFVDSYRYGSTANAFYKQTTGACGGGISAPATSMGISVGWGDKYGVELPDQYIDITGLTNGRYRLYGRADAAGSTPEGLFVESNENNNETWVDIRLRGTNTVRITAYGPKPTD